MRSITLVFIAILGFVSSALAQIKVSDKAVIKTPYVQCEKCQEKVEFFIGHESGVTSVRVDIKKHTTTVTWLTDETGIKNLTIKKKTGETYHEYDEFGKHFLKISHWYYMTCPAKQNTLPQIEENITEVKWIKTKDIKEPMKNTYPSIKDILGKFFDEP